MEGALPLSKSGNKVKEMLYTKFNGNRDTTYGIVNEETSQKKYIPPTCTIMDTQA